jgi:hypothetical protein
MNNGEEMNKVELIEQDDKDVQKSERNLGKFRFSIFTDFGFKMTKPIMMAPENSLSKELFNVRL